MSQLNSRFPDMTYFEDVLAYWNKNVSYRLPDVQLRFHFGGSDVKVVNTGRGGITLPSPPSNLEFFNARLQSTLLISYSQLRLIHRRYEKLYSQSKHGTEHTNQAKFCLPSMVNKRCSNQIRPKQ